ncbi:hypothetical protein EV195_10996 [Tenacibaculum skagerrakense]|uniref:DUF4252 domain-containing protein n=1 Tax=Tenacibaculum skagerrakense TaxID=186571 RepID=A0A4R2NNS7_9FLAO|nr:hypothetical protein [Tenacibaculum skagerrakense]TCP23370.1 hypothetical protein EV195_10996 [Tenacibaculum skagerrakense]
MRKALLLLLFVVSSAVYAQIEFIETSQSEIVGKVSYVYLEKVGENDYNFYFKNINAIGHEYVNFSFKNIDNDIDKLYNGLMQGFQTVPRDPLKMKANGQIVWLKYSREDGEAFLQIQMTSGDNPEIAETVKVSRLLTAEDITTLFKK